MDEKELIDFLKDNLKICIKQDWDDKGDIFKIGLTLKGKEISNIKLIQDFDNNIFIHN